MDLINCLAMAYSGDDGPADEPGVYFGHWVEKGFDEFTIYVAFSARNNNYLNGTETPGFPAPHSLTFVKNSGKKKKKTSTITTSERDGERFSGFIVPVSDILTSNTNSIAGGARSGYVGNPRLGKCTYPTVMWSILGVPIEDSPYLYGNLNETNPTIALKGSSTGTFSI